MSTISKERGRSLFWIYSICVILSGGFFIYSHLDDAELDILPIIISVKDHEAPNRTPDIFRENFSDSASKVQLLYLADTAFQMKYSKSEYLEHAFAGVFFPLENVEIDFSKYDAVRIGIVSNYSKRIPLNLSVQNKKYTHQYVRRFIDIDKTKKTYDLPMKQFLTPASWYSANKVSQAEIPEPDFSLVEAISIESCDLIDAGIEDVITVNELKLTKDLFWQQFFTVMIVLFLVLLCRILYW